VYGQATAKNIVAVNNPPSSDSTRSIDDRLGHVLVIIFLYGAEPLTEPACFDSRLTEFVDGFQGE
jgi:hypothetical protein